MNKAEIRKLLREKRRNEANRAEKDENICKTVLELPEFAKADTILCYHAAFGEPNLSAVIAEALKQGKRVYLPVTGENGQMEAAETLPGDALKIGRFGIFEPQGKAVPKEEIDLVLCPGVGFDRNFTRLGQGGGFYDRYLQNVHPFCVGICYTDCIMEHLPQEEHDRRMDCIVTENETWRAK